MKPHSSALATLVAALLPLPSAAANDLITTEEAMLLPPGAVSSTQFGQSSALEGDRAAMGKPWPSPGSVDVFQRNGTTWFWSAELFGSAVPNGAGFGQAIDMEGDTIVAVATDPGSFQLYVFELQLGVWVEVALLVPTDGLVTSFPSPNSPSVDLCGNTIAVGVPDAKVPGAGIAGAVYVFERTGADWSSATQVRIEDPTPGPGDEFGRSVALDGNRLAIGAPYGDLTGTTNSGWVRVYRRDPAGWVHMAALVSPDVDSSDNFGTALAYEGGVLAISAPGENFVGSVEVMVENGSGYTLQDRLFATVPKPWSLFGGALDLDGGRLAIGAPNEGPGGGLRGAAYFFSVNPNGTWVQRSRFVPSNAQSGMRFGSSVGFDGDSMVVGAPWFFAPGVPGGAAWVFRFQPPAPVSYCAAKPYGSGCLPAIGWSSLPTMTGPDDFTVICSGVPPGATGLFFWGLSGPTALPFLGGTLCVQPGLVRTALIAAQGSAPCGATSSYAFTQSTMLQEGLWNGTTVNGQWWLSDPSNPDGTGAALSDAIQLEIGP